MKSSEKKLLSLFNRLEKSGQESLLAFAEFLSFREEQGSGPEKKLEKPQIIPRPETETVVAAIKRLSTSYPMLNKPSLLNEASAIMTKHVMAGQEIKQSIDELEDLFQQFYNDMVNELEKGQQ